MNNELILHPKLTRGMIKVKFRRGSVNENPQTDTNYYRVRQVFQNNQLRYSSIQSEQFFLDEKEFSIFPNPTKDNITLQ